MGSCALVIPLILSAAAVRTWLSVLRSSVRWMSREFQVTFDAHDPRATSIFWRDALGYVHPAPPGVELPAGADPLAAWDAMVADYATTGLTLGRHPLELLRPALPEGTVTCRDLPTLPHESPVPVR